MFVSRLGSSCIFVAALALPSASAQVTEQGVGNANVIAELAGNRFHGTWWLSFGPPPQRPLILTVTRSGAFILEDSTDGGGHTPTGASFSLAQGSWTRSGPRSAHALGLRFVYAAARKTMAVERVRFSGSPGNCNWGFTVPVCPDPTTAPTEVQHGPAPFAGVRVPRPLSVGRFLTLLCAAMICG